MYISKSLCCPRQPSEQVRPPEKKELSSLINLHYLFLVNKPVRPLTEAPGLFSYRAIFLGVESVTLGKEDHYRTRKNEECYSGRKVAEHRQKGWAVMSSTYCRIWAFQTKSGGAVLPVISVWGKTFKSCRKMYQENKSPLVPTTSPRPSPTMVFGVDIVTRSRERSRNHKTEKY